MRGRTKREPGELANQKNKLVSFKCRQGRERETKRILRIASQALKTNVLENKTNRKEFPWVQKTLEFPKRK